MLLPDDADARLVLGAVLGVVGGLDACPDVQREVLVELAHILYGIDLHDDPLVGFDAATFLAAAPSAAVRSEEHTSELQSH